MTIVTKNSLTLSNVNDGTITHYAYAYSADGTDRFTTVYPNLNLLKGTRTPNLLTGNNTSNQSGSIYFFDNNKNIQNQGLSVGDTLTCEFDWDVSNPTSGTFYLQLNNTNWKSISQTISITSGNKSGHSKFSFVVDAGFLAGVATGINRRADYLPTNSILTISNVIFTKGSTTTPYMPSSSEVTNADWPSYIGQYSDFTSTVSTDPAKYAPWTIFKGNDGVGVKSTDITYAMSTSGTTAPSTGWTSSVPTLVKGQYLWTKTVWTYTDNSSKTGYSVTYISKDGTNGTNGTSGIIVSSVAPASPQNGQLWQDTSTTPQLVKKWTGSEWVIWEFYAENLKANTLQTVSAKIGKIYNEFDNSSGGIDNKGTITIEDSVKVVYYLGNSSTTIDLVTSSSGQGLFTQYLPDKTDASKFKQSWYMPTGLYFNDSINNWNGQITAENVTPVPWINITLASGYTSANGTTAQYRVIRNLDGTKHVEFRGSVGKTSGNLTTSQEQIGTLPASITPSQNTFKQSAIDGAEGGRVGAISDRRLMAWCAKETRYISLDSLTYTI